MLIIAMEEQFLFGTSLFFITLPGDMAGGVGGRSGRSEKWEEHIILGSLLRPCSLKRLSVCKSTPCNQT